MKAFIFLFILILSGCFLSGCVPCRNDDCPSARQVQFKVQDKENRNLLPWSGHLQLYTSDSVRVTTMVEEERPLSLRLEKGILHFQPEANEDTYIIRYSFAPNDTLFLRNLQVYSDKCCEETVTDYEIKVGGNFTVGDGNTVFIFTK